MTGPFKDDEVGEDHQRELEAVGLLVAGALDTQERTVVEDHLRTCERCRGELIEVGGLPGLLRRLQPDPAAGGPVWTALAEPTTSVRARLLAAGRTEVRRRARRQRALVAAGLLPIALAGALLLPGRFASTPPAAPALVAMERVDPSIDVEGLISAAERRWGTALTVEMRWSRPGVVTLVAIGRDGTEQTAGHWKSAGGDEVRCEGATSLSVDDVVRFEVRNAEGMGLLVLDT